MLINVLKYFLFTELLPFTDTRIDNYLELTGVVMPQAAIQLPPLRGDPRTHVRLQPGAELRLQSGAELGL